MILKNIFEKPVDRPIEGVIKADDGAGLRHEVEEYVLTEEIEKRLGRFLDAYINYESANGVWISGFFGSGKSHLLKMLALLLENRSLEGESTLNLFLDKCSDDKILRGDLKKAASIPSKSILFNIDQKADVISKTQVDALVSVFVKVFDETCGYYGKQGHIAQFERDLDSRELYEPFKAEYQKISGREWKTGREQALLETQNIAQAYAKVTGSPEAASQGILDKYRHDYKVSIEDFAERVQAHIDKQSPGFRVNFLVDEVGQFIADNVKLMTNLQTIAESLNTKCKGRAWILVTAQEEMDTVVGEMSKQQSHDFSKIQARFANRMKLTSTDVAKVIERRLLSKNETGITLLTDIFHEQVNNFKTLFDFSDSKTYRNFQDKEDFIHKYPFIPYQFELFQSVIFNLSQHNAFEGKHTSVGERSMLGVFQEVAKQIEGKNIGKLAPFDLMFDGITATLKSSIQRAIFSAEKNLDNFAVRLLKVLFLVKYVREFKSSLRNLCILMVEDFEQDIPALTKQVQEALIRLEQETYIQRHGDLYEFLTDEEKDIEQEIKNTEIEITDVASDLEKIIFGEIIKSNKIRYDENGVDYPLSRKLDDKLQGREYELTIHIITPFHDYDSETNLQMQNMGRNELLVILPPNQRLMNDAKLYRRTEKYIRLNTSNIQQEAIERILRDKGDQNRERYADIKRALQQDLSKAKLFIAGTAVDISGEDPQLRIIKAFNDLISRTYPHLNMMSGYTYTEKDIPKCLSQAENSLLEGDALALSEPEQEMLAFIQTNSKGALRTTIKALLDKFEKKPYGWHYAGILCILAKLCARGKVEAGMDGNNLEIENLEKYLPNSHSHSNIVLVPQIDFTASQVRSLKEFYEDFFDNIPKNSEAKALGKETSDAFKNKMQKVATVLTHSGNYPFLLALGPVFEKLREYSGKPYGWYLTDLFQEGRNSSLMEMKESAIDPILKFWDGSQKDIYDQAKKFVNEQESNFAEVSGDESERLTTALRDADSYKGNKLQQIKGLVDSLEGTIAKQLESQIVKAEETIEVLKSRLTSLPAYLDLAENQKEQIISAFDALKRRIKGQRVIAVIRDTVRRFEEDEYPRILTQIESFSKPKPAPTPKAEASSGGVEVIEAPVEPEIQMISYRSIRVSFDKPWLADEADVDKYLQSARDALLKEIKEGKRVQI